MTLTPVILAGGSGTRLWPLSREQHPKQFLSLADTQSMFQATLARLHGIDHEAPIVVCHEQHRFLAAEQLRQVNIDNARLILEPSARNTAPAITLAALRALDEQEDALLLVMPADHLIGDRQAFQASLERAVRLAGQHRLVTFGVVPAHAETGYGYIEAGAPRGKGGFDVARFVEKPDRARAEAFLATGDHFWNSGIFLFDARCYLDELARLQPAMLEACRQALASARHDMDFLRPDAEAFMACPADSIDYAVMEATPLASMVALDADWSDIGSWDALHAALPQDSHGNALRGDVMVEDGQGLMVQAEHRLVTTLGVDDLVIVETKDAVLVAHRDRVQDIKQLVSRLKAENRQECRLHRDVYRPWGVYDSIDRGDRYQVKRITVNPGARLSLQMHHHRAEHWVVVSGTAKVTNGERSYFVSENESTYIPIGQVHALENPGKIPLELIEVQSGSYLGEDDIVRLDDRYGRAIPTAKPA
ncbi:mannose-1-phosphate guanylyltransferase/mannose-6-phosphate isomerase [Onishia taeanensis]